MYQWYVELLRRFNLKFAIFDEERCESIETAGRRTQSVRRRATRHLRHSRFCAMQRKTPRPGARRELGFADRRRSASPRVDARGDRVRNTHWPNSSPQKRTRLDLCSRQRPNNSDVAGTSRDLRLLDPVRYDSLDKFQSESDGYSQLSRIVEKLQRRVNPLDAERARANSSRANRRRFRTIHAALKNYDGAKRIQSPMRLLDALIDRHGTGRVMFRNRRAKASAVFPQRVPMLSRNLDGSDADRQSASARLLAEFLSDVQTPTAHRCNSITPTIRACRG